MATNKSSNHAVADEGDSKEYILTGLAEAVTEAKLAKDGKIKGRPAKELLSNGKRISSAILHLYF